MSLQTTGSPLFINEQTVIKNYLSLVKDSKINFLETNPETKKEIISLLEELLNTKHEDINTRIKISKKLWKKLFVSAMTFIDPNTLGYDSLFNYFDHYLEFEELIFAADSFYRDHTIHLLLSYFLSEYMFRKEEFSMFFKDFNNDLKQISDLKSSIEKINVNGFFDDMLKTFEIFLDLFRYDDAIKCVMFLTHDLGYPITKIEKINKSINKILPFFGVKDFHPLVVSMGAVQQIFIEKFLRLLSTSLIFSSKELVINNADQLELVSFLRKFQSFITKNDVGDEELKLVEELRNELSSFNDVTKEMIKDVLSVQPKIVYEDNRYLRYSKDFESYAHGIMSAYLLSRLLDSFNIGLKYSDPLFVHVELGEIPLKFSKLIILSAISDHTSKGFKIRRIAGYSSFLLFVDEIEEFSRMSRAAQYRQFVNEFCKTKLYVSEDGYLTIVFVFDNDSIETLDPERAFKDKARKFLQIFDIPNLSEELRIHFIVENNLNHHDDKPKKYEFYLERNMFSVLIENEEIDRKKYLGI